MRNNCSMMGLGLVAVLGFVLISGCTEDDDGDEGTEDMITVAGEEISLGTIFGDIEEKTVVGSNDVSYTGTSLSAIVNSTSHKNPDQNQYMIIASDGFTKNVTWEDMMRGILVEEDTMTAFPVLPGRYRVKDVIEISVIETQTITVNGVLYTFDQPFDMIEEIATLTDDDNNTLEGILLSDVVNLTGLSGPEGFEYYIEASDGYSMNVTWSDMQMGILIKDEYQTYFPHLSKKYAIKDITAIRVE